MVCYDRNLSAISWSKTTGILTAAEHEAGVFTEVLLCPRTLDSEHLMIFIHERRKGKETQAGRCFHSRRRGIKRSSSFDVGGKSVLSYIFIFSLQVCIGTTLISDSTGIPGCLKSLMLLGPHL